MNKDIKNGLGITNFEHIQGESLLMCPRSESILRQREGLVHKLECKLGANNRRTKFGDPQKMIKEFSRSAAGTKIDSSNVRPLYVLHKTIKYLFSCVCSVDDVPWREIYEFVENRLRAVRQDIIVQALTGKEVLKILVPMARFYIYANYRFCETEDSNFDSYLNLKQLHEILLSILSVYDNLEYSIDCPIVNLEAKIKSKEKQKNPQVDYFDYEEEDDDSDNESSDIDLTSTINSSLRNLNISNSEPFNLADHNCCDPSDDVSRDCPYTNIRVMNYDIESKDYNKQSSQSSSTEDNVGAILKYNELEEMQALYLLVHLGNIEAITHALQLPKFVKDSPLVSCVLKANLAWMNGNHFPLIRLSTKLPPILTCALHLHLNKVQRHSINVMSSGHSSKVQKYSISDLQQVLLFDTPESLVNACKHYGLQTFEDGIQFVKTNFNMEAPLMHSERATFVEANLQLLGVSDLLLT